MQTVERKHSEVGVLDSWRGLPGPDLSSLNNDASLQATWFPQGPLLLFYISDFPLGEEAVFGRGKQLFKYLWLKNKSNIRAGTERL